MNTTTEKPRRIEVAELVEIPGLGNLPIQWVDGVLCGINDQICYRNDFVQVEGGAWQIRRD
ncbi:hypothetical protein ACT80S_18625 [Ramlibacter sp. MAHUQ-53]|uniref:hypothetical protein n=1 Tax=unclassified Ramlibacter TaxID=2617605 RepID=UPI00363E911F